MRSTTIRPRALVAGLLLASLVVTSGCSWFSRADDLYAAAPEDRPLEVPPDLDVPNAAAVTTEPAGPVTASGTVAAAGNTAAGANGFNASGTRDEVFARVDSALAAIDGVTVASRAQLLGVFDVNYQGSNFLVRVSEAEGGAYVSVVDPRGTPATGAGPEQLLAQLQAALAGN